MARDSSSSRKTPISKREIKAQAPKPLDPSEAIARIPAGETRRTEPDGEPLVRLDTLLVGEVTDHDDPQGSNRVEVRVSHPTLGDAAVYVWCRLLGQGAGDGRGVSFRPENGDEVVVGFLGGDTRHPVVLGGMWGEGDSPPVDPTAQNDSHVIATKSGLRIEFDDGDEAVTIETPGGNRIEMNDDDRECVIRDRNGSEIRMSDEGVVIASSGSLTLSAVGTVRIDGSTLTATTPSASFPGTVSAVAITTTTVVAETYTNGAGNVW